MKKPLNRTWIILGSAAVLGLGAGILATSYLKQRIAAIESAEKNKPVRKIVVARQDLQKGDRLTFDNVAVREIPADWALSGAITPDQFERVEQAVLAYPARRGEQILWAQLEGQKSATFSARLNTGRRAITVPVDEINSISGMLEPGDTIDLVATIRKDNHSISFVLLQRVKVLATGTRVSQDEPPDGRGRTYTTITLDVTPAEARRIIAAREAGKLVALLRAPGDDQPVALAKSDSLRLLGLGENTLDTATGVPVIYGGRGQNLDRVAPLAAAGGSASAGGFAPNVPPIP